MAEKKYYLSSSPHFSMKGSTFAIMLCVIVSLLPECISGILVFGWRSLLVILTGALSAVAFEALFQLCTKQRITVSNMSAALSGILLALVCPPTIPLWMVVLGSAVAMIVAKGIFGGIGSNVFNPALTGRAFLVISFPAAMASSWLNPVKEAASSAVEAGAASAMDAVSSATVLSQVKAGTLENFDFYQYFLGNRAGCIGETSILLISISLLFLIVSRIIDWRTPVSMVGTFVVCTFLSSISKGLNQALYDVAVGVFAGGLLFGATFMATDYATSPVTRPGRLVFGAGCGLITFLIRRFGGYPEGVMFSILIMNAVAPFLNNLTVRSYGYGKKGSRKPDVSKITMEFDLRNCNLTEGSAEGEAKGKGEGNE